MKWLLKTENRWDILHIFNWVLYEVNAAGCSLHLMLKQLYSSGAVRMSVLGNGNGLLSYVQQCKKMITETFTDVYRCLFS